MSSYRRMKFDPMDIKVIILYILYHAGIPLSATENAKTSIFFSVKNEPGSLVKVLNIFDQENINLMYIESRPSKKKMGEYNFCLDLEGHVTDKNIASAIEKAEKITNRIVVTGSYPQFEP